MNEFTGTIRINFAGIEATIDKPVLFQYLSNSAIKLHWERSTINCLKEIGLTAVELQNQVDRAVEVIIIHAESAFDVNSQIQKELPEGVTYDLLKRKLIKHINFTLKL